MPFDSPIQPAVFTGNGTSGPFAFGWKINDQDELDVIIRDTTDPADNGTTLTRGAANGYTVAGVGVQAGGSITLTGTYATSVTSNFKLMIRDSRSTNSTVDFKNNSSFNGPQQQAELDKLSRDINKLREDLDRALKLAPIHDDQSPGAVTNNDLLLPVASSYIRRNSANNAWEYTTELSSGTFTFPASLADNSVIRADGTDGLAYQSSNIIISDDDDITGARDFTASRELAGGVTATGTTTRRNLSDRFADVVNVKDFGAVGDGVTDDTSSVQAFIDHVASNSLTGFLPKGTYKHTGLTMGVNTNAGFSFFGEGRTATVLECSTDNAANLTIGTADSDLIHTFDISGIGFSYTNDQAGNTGAYCIYQRALDVFNWSMAGGVKFSSGYVGIKVRSGANGPWGCSWPLIEFGSGIKGGAMDWTGSTSATPNNDWGRIGIDCQNMDDGTIFKNITGYNWRIGVIEVYGGNTNQSLISFQAGAQCILGAIKCELITLNTAIDNNALIYAPSGSVYIGTVSISGATCVLTPSTAAYLLRGATTGTVSADFVVVTPTAAITSFYLAETSSRIVIDSLSRDATYPIPYTNLASSAAADYVTINEVANQRLSGDKGDANYTVTLGDPGIIMYETALTATRTVTIPGSDGDLFNGMRYRIVANGKGTTYAINIDSDSATRATIPAGSDNVFVDLVYRRFPTGGGGWKVIGRGTI